MLQRGATLSQGNSVAAIHPAFVYQEPMLPIIDSKALSSGQAMHSTQDNTSSKPDMPMIFNHELHCPNNACDCLPLQRTKPAASI
jgi:hypothetical protein